MLGAGASHGARADSAHAERPPLGKDLAGFLLGWLGASDPRPAEMRWQGALEYDEGGPDSGLWEHADELERLLERAREWGRDDGFELVMSELAERSAFSHLGTLNSIIGASFLGGGPFEARPDGYDPLVRALGRRLRAVITPNYDILFEEALGRAGTAFCYAGTMSAPADVTVYKVHGSANFFLRSGGAGSATLENAAARPGRIAEQQPFPSFYNDHPLCAAPNRGTARIDHARRDMSPVLVTYGPGKPALHARPHIDRLREECFRDLDAHPPARIIAAGIRPPIEHGADDPTWARLCATFARLESAKEYWSRVAAEREAMARFGFIGRDGYFADLVKSIEG